MKVQPIITEKTIEKAKEGKYSFWVNKGWSKAKIKHAISNLFDVEVKEVKTLNTPREVKRTLLGRIQQIKPKKKAIVSLKGKKKIDLFEEKK